MKKLSLISEKPLSEKQAWLMDFTDQILPPSESIDKIHLKNLEQGLTLVNPQLELSLCVDFLESKQKYILQKGIPKSSLIGKALGLKSGKVKTVLDATAGLGSDTWMFLVMGLKVIATERDPTVFALLKDGLERAEVDIKARPLVQSQLQLHFGEAQFYFEKFKASAEVYFFDFMFDIQTKSLPKKAMQVLQSLNLPSGDEEEILKMAMNVSKKRIVVKRSLRAPALVKAPTVAFKGKSIRYDVYLT